MSNLRRGRAKIEFYQHIKEIRKAYYQGFVVYKVLYEKMRNDLNLKMGYDAFLKYAKIEFEPNTNKKEVGKKSGQTNNESNNSELIEGEVIEPVSDTSLQKLQIDKDTQKAMEEYMKNMEHIFKTKKRSTKQWLSQ